MGRSSGIFLALTIIIWEVHTITIGTNQKTFRRHAGTTPQVDWELGLREAVNQVLLKEHHSDPHLREHLLEAPLYGRQNSATPFGDIAILARGQLYATPEGYQFVQDPYQNDCDDCHNERKRRCNRLHCESWKSQGHEQLLALWTVKRIRHRDPNKGHVFELEYTISPIGELIREGFITRNGNFDYGVPGHVFVIRSDPQLNHAYNLNNNQQLYTGDKWYRNQENDHYGLPANQDHTTHSKPPILIGISPNGYKQVLHNYPEYYPSYLSQPQGHNREIPQQPITTDPKEIQLYKELLQSLASKTAVPHRNSLESPHRFSMIVTRPTQTLVSTFVPKPATTLIQFPDGELFPVTDNTLPQTTTKQVATSIRFPTTSNQPITGILTTAATLTTKPTYIHDNPPNIKYSEPDPYYPSPTAAQTFAPKPPTRITMPVTLHYYTPVEEATTKDNPKTTSQIILNSKTHHPPPIYVTSVQQQKTTTPQVMTITTLKNPKTSTVDEDFDLFFDNTPTQSSKLTTTGFFETPKPTIPQQETTKFRYFATLSSEELPSTKLSSTSTSTTSTSTTETIQSTRPQFASSDEMEDEINLFSVNIPTEPMKPITQVPIRKSTNPTKEQLGIPETDSVTTSSYLENTPEIEVTTKHFDYPKTTSAVDQFELPEFSTKNILNTIQTHHSTIQESESTPTKFVVTTIGSTYTTENFLPSTLDIGSTKNSESTAIYQEPPTTATQYYTSPKPTEIPIKDTTIKSVEQRKPATASTILPSTEHFESTRLIPITHTIKTTTPKSKPAPTSTNAEEFLIDKENGNVESPKKVDNIDDDIFGPETKLTSTTSRTTKNAIVQSEFAGELFGSNRRAKKFNLANKSRPKPKIIYSNFYVAPTEPPITQQMKGSAFLMEQVPVYDVIPTKDDIHPLTDQSYSTSISFEVNKKNKSHTGENNPFKGLHLEPTIAAKLSEIVNHNSDYKIYKAELPDAKTTTVKAQETNSNKEFDHLALQLVNHARSIDYLNGKHVPPKFKRRSYKPKTRRIQKNIA